MNTVQREVEPEFGRQFSDNVKSARELRLLTQNELAILASISRPQIVRMESGSYSPDVPQLLRLAAALRVPLEYLTAGRWRPSSSLRGLAFDLHRLGIRDLEVSGSEVPGSLRHPEEVVALALAGDRPEVRVLEALPLVLAGVRLRVPLVNAFALSTGDKRVRTRLGWLCDITLILSKQSTFPATVVAPRSLEVLSKRFLRFVDKKAAPDTLGHPGNFTSRLLPWKRWHINYAGRLDDFLKRSQEAAGGIK